MIEEKLKNEFLEKHLQFFIKYNSYMVLHFSILYWHFDDVEVLKNVLTSDTIKEEKGNVVKTESGEKIYYELYTYLRLMKSDAITNWLTASYPLLEDRYQDDFVFYGFACIDSSAKKVKEDVIMMYNNLDEMIKKYK